MEGCLRRATEVREKPCRKGKQTYRGGMEKRQRLPPLPIAQYLRRAPVLPGVRVLLRRRRGPETFGIHPAERFIAEKIRVSLYLVPQVDKPQDQVEKLS